MKRTTNDLKTWAMVVVVGCGLTVFGYTVGQQVLRTSANDPQRQLAEDVAARLSAGGKPSEVVITTDQVDVAHSLAPFVVITDQNGKALASSGKLDSSIPLPPAAAFADAQKRGQNWFTWQPNAKLREATVIIPYSGAHPGYVLAARSLRQVEANYHILDQLALMTLLGVLGAPTLILLLV